MAYIETGAAAAQTERGRSLYFAVWRWHFYAGLYVAPFLLMLAVTGLIMLWTSWLFGQNGERSAVPLQGIPAAVSVQAAAATEAVPEGVLKAYVSPLSPSQVAVFRVDGPGGARAVMVDPHAAAVTGQMPWRGSLYDIATGIHGSLLLGDLGDRLIEIAASLGVVLVVTGAVLWWPRGGRPGALRRALVPDLRAGGRAMWRTLHGAVGVWSALMLVVVLITGLSWAGIWGTRVVQAWATYPAGKWGADVPLSDATHASLNHGSEKSVPWGLEQTQLPASGGDAAHAVHGAAAGAPTVAGAAAAAADPHAGHHGAPAPAPVVADARWIGGAPAAEAPSLDQLAAYAAGLGFDGRFQLAFPDGPTGVWTISHDSQSNDGRDPSADRTIHVDRYDGRILADIRYGDYNPYAKAMAWGIAFHEGDMGWWNLVLNTLFCLSIITLSVSGAVMWWLRRPSGAGRLGAPPMPRGADWRLAALVALVPAVLFPLAGLTLAVVLALDWLVLGRLPALRRRLA